MRPTWRATVTAEGSCGWCSAGIVDEAAQRTTRRRCSCTERQQSWVTWDRCSASPRRRSQRSIGAGAHGAARAVRRHVMQRVDAAIWAGSEWPHRAHCGVDGQKELQRRSALGVWDCCQGPGARGFTPHRDAARGDAGAAAWWMARRCRVVRDIRALVGKMVCDEELRRWSEGV
jgi:hypothetical protein